MVSLSATVRARYSCDKFNDRLRRYRRNGGQGFAGVWGGENGETKPIQNARVGNPQDVRKRPIGPRMRIFLALRRRPWAAVFRVSHLARRAKRVHTSDRRSLTGSSLAAETNESQDGESRLKAGCSQDWLPHKARGFLRSKWKLGSPFPGATHVSR
jgi:hypothetical protein